MTVRLFVREHAGSPRMYIRTKQLLSVANAMVTPWVPALQVSSQALDRPQVGTPAASVATRKPAGKEWCVGVCEDGSVAACG